MTTEDLISDAKRNPLRVADADANAGRIAFLMNGRDLPMDNGTAWHYMLEAPGCLRLFKVIGRGKRKGIKLEPLEADGRKAFDSSQGCVVLSQGNVALLPESLVTPEALAVGRVIVAPASEG